MAKTLTLTTLNSPLGEITLLLDTNTLLVCEFADKQERVTRQIRQYYSGHHIVPGHVTEGIRLAFEQYFAGDAGAFSSIKTSPKGTAFECNVWQTLRTIPAGTVRNYGAIAAELNSSARAVGRANGRNPISLIIPCHRVIGANGALTGYAGGLDRKEWLLKHEGVLLNL